MEICRACLGTGTEMVQMDKNFTNNYNILTGLCLKFTKKKKLYTCKACFDGTNFCTEFRNRCIASDLSLQEINQGKKHLSQDNNQNIQKKDETQYTGNIDDSPGYYSDKKDEEDDDSYLLVELKSKTIDETFNDYSDLNKKEENVGHIDFVEELKTETIDNSDNYYLNKRNETEDNHIDEKEEKEYTHIDFIADNKTKINVKRKCKKNIHLQKSKKIKLRDLVYCKICPDKFADENGLTEHLKNHEFNVPCCLCGEEFVNLPHLLGHRIVHMPKDQMSCHICHKKFLTDIGLEFHYMRVHEFSEKNTPIRCKKCPKSFENSKRLRSHNRELHSNIKYTCEICATIFTKRSNLQFHMIKHGQTKIYECDLCDYTSKYRSGLTTHITGKHTEGRVYCKTCSRVFMSQSVLEKHICKNASAAQICPICGLNIKIRRSNTLKQHMKIHDAVCMFKCEMCPAKFKNSQNYKTHMDKHAGTPKHCCEYCQRSFYSLNVLIKHRRTHTGAKPYVCSICNKGFTGNHNLKVHMKVHGMNLIIKRDTKED